MAEAGGENPFKRAFEPVKREELIAKTSPFAKDTRLGNLAKREQLRTVAEMNLVDREVLDRSPKIRELTVKDLNDLAAEFTGIPSNNEKVASLTLEDIQDLEGVFFEFKVSALRDVATAPGDLAAVDVSCCCCTPCCCCAATDMSQTA
jgi:hypothetical protein